VLYKFFYRKNKVPSLREIKKMDLDEVSFCSMMEYLNNEKMEVTKFKKTPIEEIVIKG